MEAKLRQKAGHTVLEHKFYGCIGESRELVCIREAEDVMAKNQKRRQIRNGKPRNVLHVIAVVLGFALVFAVYFFTKPHRVDVHHQFVAPTNFQELLALSSNDLDNCDIALMNLLCADGLRGAENLNISQCMNALDAWTKHVQSETERNLHRFRENPSEGDGSEAKWRMLMLITVLQQDLHVRYNPARMESPETSSPNDTFFADPRDVLLHGLLKPPHMGTCSSLPVLYVAIGRRLGYPVKLVATKGHLFVRWHDSGERTRRRFLFG